jgi:hypothetical protein
MTRFWIFFAALAAIVFAGAAHADQGDGRRVALVIGNAAYAGAGALNNPVRDARLVAGSLSAVGFTTVVTAEDLDVEKFQRRLREFRRVADGASIAVVYFAGHGLEVNGRNWLVPLNATLSQPNDLLMEAVALEQVLTAVGGATVKVVILDACRNNPFERALRRSTGVAVRSDGSTGGLAAVADAALSDGMIVMYAAAPGATASDGAASDRNSPFARALTEKIPTRGVDFRIVAGGVRDLTLRYTQQVQRPFLTLSLGEAPVYLTDATPSPTIPSTTTPAPNNAEVAQRMFQRAKAAANGGDCEALIDYAGIAPADLAPEARRAAETCRGGFLSSLKAVDAAGLNDADILRLAAIYRVESAAVRAILEVEGQGKGFAPDGRPLILFEPHIFSRLTNRRFDVSHPHVSYRTWRTRPYPPTQDGRWEQLREAYALDPEAAVSATSWGRFQIMGLNFAPSGYTNASAFVAAMSRSEAIQARALFDLVQSHGRLDEVQRLDWEGFVRVYGGGPRDREEKMLREAYERYRASAG